MTLTHPDPCPSDLSWIVRLPYDDPAWDGIRRVQHLLTAAEYTAAVAGHARALADAAERHWGLPQLDLEAHRRRGLAAEESTADDVVMADARGYSIAVDEIHAALWEARHGGEEL